MHAAGRHEGYRSRDVLENYQLLQTSFSINETILNIYRHGVALISRVLQHEQGTFKALANRFLKQLEITESEPEASLQLDYGEKPRDVCVFF